MGGKDIIIIVKKKLGGYETILLTIQKEKY
jgi:hypothetical protein